MATHHPFADQQEDGENHEIYTQLQTLRCHERRKNRLTEGMGYRPENPRV